MSRKVNYSFAEWLIDSLGEDALSNYWSDSNDINPWDVSFQSHKKVLIKCQEKDYHGDYETYCYSFIAGRRCPYCKKVKLHPKDSFAQWGIKKYGNDFLKKYWGDENTKSPWEISPHTHNDSIWVKCQSTDYHGEYKTNPNRFTLMNCRCSYCSGKKLHQLDSLGQYLLNSSNESNIQKIWSEKNKKSPLSYSHKSSVEVWWKCENGEHKDYKRKISASNRYNFRCPQCVTKKDESILQEKVRTYLTTTLGYTLNHEYQCKLKCVNPITGRVLPYDNELLISDSTKLIIEVHGVQHYKTSTWTEKIADEKNITVEEELQYMKWKDSLKQSFAVHQGYNYLVIPYWSDNKENEWKKLIDLKLTTK